MKVAHTRRTRTIKACVGATTSICGLLMVGCSRYLPGTEKSWTVGNGEVYETIQRTKNDWPDAQFLRTYRLKREKLTLTVGSYENESEEGVIKRPYAVGEYIVIPTSCYVYRVGPDNQVDEFYPWKVGNWLTFSQPLGINGHYDYEADRVEHEEGVWRLTYALKSGLNGQRPKFIHFVTPDDWQSFQTETESSEDVVLP